MKFFTSLLAISLALSIALVTTGCPEKTGDTTSNEEAWIRQFKSEVSKVEKRFFETNYILNVQDPFYLEEALSRLALGKPVSKVLANKIRDLKDEYSDSWPVLTQQLERTQLIFAITSVLPAVQANYVLAERTSAGFDAEVLGLVGEFRKAVEQGTVFGGKNASSRFGDDVVLDLAPQTRAEVVEYANKIAARTLVLIDGAPELSGSLVRAAAKTQLESKRQLICLLNPKVASTMGQALTADERLYVEEPLKLWNELKTTYDAIFALLTLEGGPKEQVEMVKLLRKQEQELVKKIHFATERQFFMAKSLLGGKK